MAQNKRRSRNLEADVAVERALRDYILALKKSLDKERTRSGILRGPEGASIRNQK
jgi:hypothetical protein